MPRKKTEELKVKADKPVVKSVKKDNKKPIEGLVKKSVASKVTIKKVVSSQVKVTQTKSFIGRKENQVLSLKALGLGKIGMVRLLADTPEVKGLINRVKHLIKVEII